VSGHRVNLHEPLLTVDEAATLLALRPTTIYQWVREGRLPCVRLGPRAIRFTRSLLEQWASEQIEARNG
jgi:excisionase family DNA binding protein